MTIKKKLLTPSKFNLNTMKPMTSAQIEAAVTKRIKTLDLTPAAKAACNYIITQSIAGKQSFPGKFEGLTQQDIGVITSDFGEVAGALYMLNSKQKYTHAKFPIDENERLVDYYLVRDGIDEKISAKAGEGGAPAITAVEKALDDMDPKALTPKLKKALHVLQLISKGTVYGGVLQVAQYLKMPGYLALVSLLTKKELKTGYTNTTKIPDQEYLIKAVDAMGSFDSAMKICKPLFAAANFTLGGADKMKSVFAGTASSRYKKWGMVHFPITSEVMGWLNDTNNGATEILTMAARTLTVNQIYLDYKNGNLTYTVHTFSDADFKFHSPSSTPNPVGNRIGMKMIKSAAKSKK
jgi:hypothetical protein